MSTRWAGAVTQALASGDAERTYRLDVAAGRCEFLLHQCMSREHQLVGGGRRGRGVCVCVGGGVTGVTR